MSNIYDTAPSSAPVAVTKSDVTTYSPPLRGVYVGGAGDVAILAPGATTAVTFSSVPAGSVLPVKAIKIMSTNTTATNIVGLA